MRDPSPVRFSAALLLAGLAAGCGARSALEPAESHDELCAEEREPENPLGIIELALGRSHSCALTAEHTVRCWGRNDHGQLGDGTLTDRASPVQVQGLTDVVQLSAGEAITCAVRADRTGWCWGEFPPYPDAEMEDFTEPEPTPSLGELVQIAATSRNATGLRTDGTIRTLYYGDIYPELQDVAEMIPGSAYELGCVRFRDGTVSCARVLLGLDEPSDPVERVPEFDDAIQITAGEEHVCARLASEELECYGSNVFGQLGPIPDPPAYGASVSGPDVPCGREIALGNFHSCRIARDRTVWCWGDDTTGQLGRSVETKLEGTFDPVAQRVPGVSDIAYLALGGGRPAVGGHTCAVGASGLVCWGSNEFGQLGDGSTVTRATPAPVLW